MTEKKYHYECLCTKENQPILLGWEYDRFIGGFNPDGTDYEGEIKDLVACKPIKYTMSPGFIECYWELLKRWWRRR